MGGIHEDLAMTPAGNNVTEQGLNWSQTRGGGQVSRRRIVVAYSRACWRGAGCAASYYYYLGTPAAPCRDQCNSHAHAHVCV